MMAKRNKQLLCLGGPLNGQMADAPASETDRLRVDGLETSSVNGVDIPIQVDYRCIQFPDQRYFWMLQGEPCYLVEATSRTAAMAFDGMLLTCPIEQELLDDPECDRIVMNYFATAFKLERGDVTEA